jgi:hypothetical protein
MAHQMWWTATVSPDHDSSLPHQPSMQQAGTRQFDRGELPDRRWHPVAYQQQKVSRKPEELGIAQLLPWGTRPRPLLSRR